MITTENGVEMIEDYFDELTRKIYDIKSEIIIEEELKEIF